MRLPVRELSNFSSSYNIAVKRLCGTERRFARDDHLYEQYSDFLSEYEALGHMSLLKPPKVTDSHIAYLPHHGVWKSSGDSSKLRVVFNGSAGLECGVTLNQHFLVGQNLLPSLFDALLKWRLHRYVFVTDIEKMYRQILVHPEDRNLQRILWRREPTVPISEYQLNTITYGLSCAPYLAMRTLRQLAIDEVNRLPEASKILQSGVYMVDILAGASTLTDAKLLMDQLIDICKSGGMPLRKWASNSAELLVDIPLDDQQGGSRSWETREGCSTLGLLWHPRNDHLTFSVNLPSENCYTKRRVLSQTAQLFDPFGWLAPVVIWAKVFMQGLWLRGVEWDVPLLSDEAEDWSLFRDQLPLLSSLHVPRWLGTCTSSNKHEVYGFSDASESAYAVV